MTERLNWNELNEHEFGQTTGDSEYREAWHAAVHGVAKSQTWLSDEATMSFAMKVKQAQIKASVKGLTMLYSDCCTLKHWFMECKKEGAFVYKYFGKQFEQRSEIITKKLFYFLSIIYVVAVPVQSLSLTRLLVTPWTAAHQTSLSFTISWSLLKLVQWVVW